MAFNPAEFATLADALCVTDPDGHAPSEAALRIAVGRYYYAALLVARDYLDETTLGGIDRSERTHRAVLAALKAEGAGATVQLVADLNTMRHERTRADYGDEMQDLASVAKRMGSKCRRALGAVAALARRRTTRS